MAQVGWVIKFRAQSWRKTPEVHDTPHHRQFSFVFLLGFIGLF